MGDMTSTCAVPGCERLKGEEGVYCLTHWTRDRELRRARERGERETIARVVAWLRATPGERGLPWVDYAHDIADLLETGDWRNDDGR